MRRWFVLAFPAALLAAALAPSVPPGINPDPVALVRPSAGPLSAMARLGRSVFFDPSLSSSGRMSCASCHSPAHAYGPPGDGSAMDGGPHLSRQGTRAVPSLMYLERQPRFSIGPDSGEDEDGSATPVPSATNLVPQGGLFWDGRADTLQNQAMSPLLNPSEMDGGSVARVAAKLRGAAYAPAFASLFGATIFDDPKRLVDEALFAVARYEFEDPSFHPYTSKFDYWLEGKARFTPAEMRGYRLFNDPHRADCAACHLDRPTPDRLPPLLTDHQFEALGVPRNAALAANSDRSYYDLGLCGPVRSDLRRQGQYCGYFLTPTLRNVATRHVFFHNGIYHTLRAVLDFYDFRDTRPQKIYPRAPDGTIEKEDDLPRRYRANVDVKDPPFDRRRGETPVMSPQDERDLIAFLRTLTDGYRPR